MQPTRRQKSRGFKKASHEMKQAKGFVFKPLSPAPFTELSQRKDVFPLIMYFNTVTLKASLCSRKRVQKKKILHGSVTARSCWVNGILKSLKTSCIIHHDSVCNYQCSDSIPADGSEFDKRFPTSAVQLHIKRGSCLICNRTPSPSGVSNSDYNNRLTHWRPPFALVHYNRR